MQMITKLFPNKSNVYAKGPVGENVLHVAMLLNTPSTLAITRFLVKMFGAQLVNTPIQVKKIGHGRGCSSNRSSSSIVTVTARWTCCSTLPDLPIAQSLIKTFAVWLVNASLYS
jgi:hypothetical protein